MIKDEKISNPDKKATLLDFDKVLGLNLSEAQEFIEKTTKTVKKADMPQEVQELLEQREEARLARDFAKADELRAKIETAGYSIKDSSAGPVLTKI